MKKIMFNDKFGLTEAVLNGTKTMTRRIFSNQVFGKLSIENNPLRINEKLLMVNGSSIRSHFPKYQVGEIVAVAQSYSDIFKRASEDYSNGIYEAFNSAPVAGSPGWENKMFVKADLMPTKIQMVGIKIELLQDISDDDCLKEGIYKGKCGSKETHFMDAYYFSGEVQPYCTPRDAYSELINRINGRGTWERNPYVFAYEFKVE